MTSSPSGPIYRHEFTIPESAVDQNGHVNNVVYVQWMQDVAVLHSEASGGSQATRAVGAIWVARSHHIEYLCPSYAGEQVEALTWVSSFRRIRSIRCYQFRRKVDGTMIARGETEWVFVDAITGRPKSIPEAVIRVFPLGDKDGETFK